MNRRVERLRDSFERWGIDSLLVASGANRRYLSGFTGSAGMLLITLNRCALITDFRYLEQAKAQAPGFEIIDNRRDMAGAVKKALADFGIKRIGFEKNHFTYEQYETYAGGGIGPVWVPVKGLVEELRMIKDEQELKLIRRAAKIADEAFAQILPFIRPGVKEIEVAQELEYQMRKRGAAASAFELIVASGERSAMPHGAASWRTIREGDLVTLDFGAVYEGYVSDITRTVAVGKIAEPLKRIYEIVLKAQLNGVNNIKAGMTGREADALCREIIREAGYGDCFGHSTGHAIGLEVHEAPSLSPLSDAVLQPGMVVTVEPGIYLEGVGGVRIEDDVLITESGKEILTHAPKDLIILS